MEMWEGSSEKINGAGGLLTYSIGVIVVTVIWQLFRRFYFFRSRIAPPPPPPIHHPSIDSDDSSTSLSPLGISCIISDSDLKNLIDNLDESVEVTEKWDNVIQRSNGLLSYSAKCCKPKDSPLKYLSVTVFEDCSAELLKDFYMDNSYRKQWDNTLIEQEHLQVDETNGTEIGRLIKKFPLLTPREYVLAWRLWEKGEDTYYCFSKECEHPLAPRQKKYVRVRFLRSGWMIRSLPGRNACEIRMMHQEDAGLNAEMAKLAFMKGIWSYMSKMNKALRKYGAVNNLRLGSAVNSIALVQKVPFSVDSSNSPARREMSMESVITSQVAQEGKKGCSRRPSNMLIANGLILLGGVICLSRGRPNFGAKVAMSYILTKVAKRGPSSARKACFSSVGAPT